MQQSPSWEVNRSSASQEIPHISWNPKVHEGIRKHPQKQYKNTFLCIKCEYTGGMNEWLCQDACNKQCQKKRPVLVSQACSWSIDFDSHSAGQGISASYATRSWRVQNCVQISLFTIIPMWPYYSPFDPWMPSGPGDPGSPLSPLSPRGPGGPLSPGGPGRPYKTMNVDIRNPDA